MVCKIQKLYGDLKMLVINTNLSAFIICKNKRSIINTIDQILHVFYILVRLYLRTFIISTSKYVIIAETLLVKIII